MVRRLLAGLIWLGYGVLLLVAFVVSGYLAFSLFVRSGVTTVPSLVGMARAEAVRTLLDQGLQPRRETAPTRYDDKVPAGHVVRQNPDGHTLVKLGSGVQIVLSLGPRRVEVPNLT